MASTPTRRAQRAVRHAGRALRRRRVPEVLGAIAAAVVLSVGGAGLALETNHDDGHVGHGMVQQFGPMPDGNQPGGHRDHPHPPWEH